MKTTETSWITKSGKTVKIVFELQTQKTINADGHKINIECCEIQTKVFFDNSLYSSNWIRPTKLSGCVARVGDLGISAENYTKVQEAEKQIEATPEWQNKMDKDKRAKQANQDHQDQQKKIRYAMGEGWSY